MIRLLLIRHAKSAWDVAGLADHERRLNERGRRDAPRIGRWLRAEGLVPDWARVSDAARTRETWDRLGLGDVEAEFVPDLYEAGPETILRVIRGAPAGTLAVVGHNPGLGEAAGRLLRERPADPIFGKYPTGAVAVIDFEAAGWSGVGWGGGRLVEFVTPKTLPEG